MCKNKIKIEIKLYCTIHRQALNLSGSNKLQCTLCPSCSGEPTLPTDPKCPASGHRYSVGVLFINVPYVKKYVLTITPGIP